jgi:hypothetical protein
MAVVAFKDFPNSGELGAALAEADPGNLLPSGIGLNAARADEDLFSPVVAALALRGVEVRPAQIIRVPKVDRSTRPAADVPALDQIIYTAAVNRLKAELYPGLVTFTGAETDGGYVDFAEFPLQQTDVKYVLIADAASFYEYVDHERLAYELIGATGDSALTESLLSMLDAWMTTPRGLPQGPGASAILADVYISPVGRALARAGFRFRRYSDDFRVLASSWTEAKEAQLALEQAMREVGLAVAPGKLLTPTMESYRRQIEAIRQEREILPDLQVGTVGEYSDEEVLAVSDEEVARAQAIFETLLTEKRVGVQTTRSLRWALPRLAYAGSLGGLQNLGWILRRYPHITPSLTSYFRVLIEGGHEEPATIALVDWFQTKPFTYPWQLGWLMHATCYWQQARRRIGRIARGVLSDGSMPWFVRGQAALSTAVHGELPNQREFVGAFELAPEATKPDMVAAVLIGNPSWRESFLEGVSGNPILRATGKLDPQAYREWLR